MVAMMLPKFLIIFVCLLTTRAANLEECSEDLGMSSSRIPDEDISASSSFLLLYTGPSHARLGHEGKGGAWCPRYQVNASTYEYLQIDLQDVYVISGISTQGRFGNRQGIEYTPWYRVEYQQRHDGPWIRWSSYNGTKLLRGARSEHEVHVTVRNELRPPVVARRIRVIPYSELARTVCLRLELHGCRWNSPVISYSAPIGTGSDALDASYSGKHGEGYMTGGLGKLTDGIKSGAGAWLNWDNSTLPVVIDLRFSGVHNVSAIEIYSSGNDHAFPIRLRVWTSVGGRQFDAVPVDTEISSADTQTPNEQLLVAAAGDRLGSLVRLEIWFSSSSLSISEINVVADAVLEPLTSETLTSEQMTSGRRVDVSGLSVNYPPTTDFRASSDRTPHNPQKDNQPNKVASSESNTSELRVILVALSVLVTALLLAALLAGLYYNRTHKLTKQQQKVQGSFVSNELASTAASAWSTPDIMANLAQLTPVSSRNGGTDRSSSDPEMMKPLLQTLHHTPIKQHQASPALQHQASPALYSKALPNQYSTVQPYHTPCHGCQTVYTAGHQVSLADDCLPQYQSYPSSQSSFRNGTTSSGSAVESCAGDPVPPGPRRPNPTNDSLHYASSDVTGQLPPDSPINVNSLRIVKTLGRGQFGLLHLCEAADCSRLVTLHVLPPTAETDTADEFADYCRRQLSLRHQNICAALHVDSPVSPSCLVLEYSTLGNLCAFLQDCFVSDVLSEAGKTHELSKGDLLYIASQVSSALSYLESFNVVHGDVALRNCLISHNLHVKLTDVARWTDEFRPDYCLLPLTTGYSAPQPLRWMAVEDIIRGERTVKSDVWSFALLLWQLLDVGRHVPYAHLSDSDVLVAATTGHLTAHLHEPQLCSKHMWQLLQECWSESVECRPAFSEIHMFLLRNNVGYRN